MFALTKAHNVNREYTAYLYIYIYTWHIFTYDYEPRRSIPVKLTLSSQGLRVVGWMSSALQMGEVSKLYPTVTMHSFPSYVSLVVSLEILQMISEQRFPEIRMKHQTLNLYPIPQNPDFYQKNRGSFFTGIRCHTPEILEKGNIIPIISTNR